jgi:hypothetical protein
MKLNVIALFSGLLVPIISAAVLPPSAKTVATRDNSVNDTVYEDAVGYALPDGSL